ncbi:MAG: hypothetical protein EBV29_11090, partial [Gammaproteobacteria bacterium]|nr:hypothetical protein [Gammaproteobacteria bacterium]
GAMGPVTPAGCMAEILAETLAGMALTQLVRPGAPVIMGSFVGAVSMRSGAPGLTSCVSAMPAKVSARISAMQPAGVTGPIAPASTAGTTMVP